MARLLLSGHYSICDIWLNLPFLAKNAHMVAILHGVCYILDKGEQTMNKITNKTCAMMGKVATSLSILAIVGCGDTDSWSPMQQCTDDFEVETVDELPDCTDELRGSFANVAEVKSTYVCRDDMWKLVETKEPESSPDTDPKAKSSSSSEKPSSSSESKRKGASSGESSSSSVDDPVSSDTETEMVDSSSFVDGILTDFRNGRKYRTTTVGKYTWMDENLDFATDSSTCYDNLDSNCTKYGRLYNWADAMDAAGRFSDDAKGCFNDVECNLDVDVIMRGARGICPAGWHIPGSSEGNELNEKFKRGIPVDSVMNMGFNVQYGGNGSIQADTVYYDNIGKRMFLWTSWSQFMQYDATPVYFTKTSTYIYSLTYDNVGIYKTDRISVRCVLNTK